MTASCKCWPANAFCPSAIRCYEKGGKVSPKPKVSK